MVQFRRENEDRQYTNWQDKRIRIVCRWKKQFPASINFKRTIVNEPKVKRWGRRVRGWMKNTGSHINRFRFAYIYMNVCSVCVCVFVRVHKKCNESTIAFFTFGIISMLTSQTNTHHIEQLPPLNKYCSLLCIRSFIRMSMTWNWKFISTCNSKWSVLNFSGVCKQFSLKVKMEQIRLTENRICFFFHFNNK